MVEIAIRPHTHMSKIIRAQMAALIRPTYGQNKTVKDDDLALQSNWRLIINCSYWNLLYVHTSNKPC